VLLDTAEVDLVEAVLTVARGDCYLSPPLAGQMRPHPRELSAWHTAVLCLLARDYPDARVARELNLSMAALESCRGEIYRRLGMVSPAELARYALRHGLLGAD
jgi:DNA-binding NarL/FixJ family response regulator